MVLFCIHHSSCGHAAVTIAICHLWLCAVCLQPVQSLQVRLFMTIMNVNSHLHMTRYTFTQDSGAQTAFIMADSQLVWKDQQATASRTCSSGDTVSVIVNEVILHTGAFVIVQIWGEQASGGGSFKVANAEMGYTLLILVCSELHHIPCSTCKSQTGER